MDIFNKNILVLFIAVLAISCSNDGKDDEYIKMQKFIVDLASVETDADNEDNEISVSRASDYGSGISANLKFEYLDTVGIFTKDGAQIPFPLPILPGSPQASVAVSAQGWMTKYDESYVLYLPYNFYNRDSRKIPWDGRVTFQQSTNNNKLHVGKYWMCVSDTMVQRSTDGQFKKTLHMVGCIIRIRAKVIANANYIRMMLVTPGNTFFSTHGYYDFFDMPTQPYTSLGQTDHVALNMAPSARNASQYLTGFFYFPDAINMQNQTLGCYIWDENGNCYYGQTVVTGTNGLWNRNSERSINIDSFTLVTSPTVKMNPWDDEDLCPTCNPVAF